MPSRNGDFAMFKWLNEMIGRAPLRNLRAIVKKEGERTSFLHLCRDVAELWIRF
jgi:hypothetical protein